MQAFINSSIAPRYAQLKEMYNKLLMENLALQKEVTMLRGQQPTDYASSPEKQFATDVQQTLNTSGCQPNRLLFTSESE